MISSNVRARLGLCTSVLALLATGPAFAQIDTGPPESAADTAQVDEPADEEIIVTGSRIQRPELEVAVPIVSVTSEAIEATGLNNLTDVLIRNPALTASVGGSISGGADAGFNETGSNLLDLRNLGTNRTLVLVDGRRHVAGVPNSAAVDINTIPQDLVEKIDVLTGGASAIYGADGVSGVVNFILRRNFEGVTARAQAGISDDGDAGSQLVSVIAGTNFSGGRGNITAAYEYSNSDRLSSFDRPYTGDNSRYRSIWQNIDDFQDDENGDPVDDPNVFDQVPYVGLTWFESAPDGAVDLDLDFTADRTGSGLVYDGGTFLPGGGGRAIGGLSNTPTAGYFGDLFPQIERHIANVLTRYEFSPAFNLFAEGKYVRSRAYSVGQPSFDFFTYLQPDNAFLLDRFGAGAAPDGAYVSRDNFDFGIRGERITRETLRFVGGADGDITEDARYEVSYVYGELKSRSVQTANLIGDRYFAALDAVRAPNGQIVCRTTLDPGSLEDDPNFGSAPSTFTPGANSPCRPLNILGNGVATPEALAFVLADNVSRATIRQHVVSGSISGDFDRLLTLPGGSIGFALGAEYRKEESSSDPDDLLENGEFRDFAALPASGGEFDVKEAFAELNVPILADMPFAELLSASAAVRLSDYSTIGSTSTWKVDAIYAPIEDIRFRGSYSQAVRAPNVGELFTPATGTFLFVTDPCDITRVDQGTEFRQANCTAILSGLGLSPAQIAAFNPSGSPTASTSRRGTTGGNPDLSEETARTWTAGVILRPRFVPGLTVTFDWYNIRIRDAVNTPTATELAELCVDQPTIDNIYCDNIFRAQGTGFVLGDGNDPQQRIGFNVGPSNVAAFRTSGADFGISYAFEPIDGVGRFNLNLVGGYLDTITFVPTPGAEIDDDILEQYNPRWRGSANVTWTLDDLSVNYGVVYWSKTRRYTTEVRDADPDISDPRYFFYNERWEHDIRAELRVDDRFSFYGGVNNIFEQEPDLGLLSYPVSGVGRFIYAGAKVTLPSF